MSDTDGHDKTPHRAIPTVGEDIGQHLRELDAPGPGDVHLDQMYSAVRAQCDEHDRGVAGYLRNRPTTVRRAICFGALGLIGAIAMLTLPMVDPAKRTTEWAATLAAYLVLMAISIVAATRPLQLPTLPKWRGALLAALAVGATLVAVLLPSAHTHAPSGSSIGFGPCMGIGLLIGLPVYAVIRLVDRGNALGGLLAAAAAGLAGNFLLTYHCPATETGHIMAGHVSVAVIFVVGLGLVHWLVRGMLPR